MKKQYQVIIKTSSNNRPRDHELSAALILTDFFQNDIILLRPIPMKSPDLAVKREKWELKSPTGSSKSTIANCFKSARKQSNNIIIDLRRCKLNEQNAKSRIRDAIRKRRRKNGRVLVINKRGKVLDFSSEMRYYKPNRY